MVTADLVQQLDLTCRKNGRWGLDRRGVQKIDTLPNIALQEQEWVVGTDSNVPCPKSLSTYMHASV